MPVFFASPALPGSVAAHGIVADGEYVESRLANGVVVLTETIPSVRSVAVGVWVRHGTAHEDAAEMGVSHLLEHMVFKGTERRSAREIALALESLGGSLDAYTSREHTSYEARVLDEHLPMALDVLADLVLSPVLRDGDLEREREVVLEEISTVEDTPDDLVFELHADTLWPAHPYGYSILGTRATVAALSSESLRALHASAYGGRNLIVAAAGHLAHEVVVDEVARLFGRIPAGCQRRVVPPPRPHVAGDQRVARDSAQTHIVFGTVTPGHSDPRRYPLVLLAAAFGGGMSSRLFQRVREDLGLAYSVYSFQSFYELAGVTGVYVGTRPEWADRAVAVIRREYETLATRGLGSEELEQTKGQVKGQIMLSLESTGARVNRLASFALFGEPFLTLDELLARVDAVTNEQIAEVAGEFFRPDDQLVLRLGPRAAGGAAEA
ncbi:MAG: insulinase family protein [Gemmatimonadetes bacterium]|nr:insulinase family protein [Gemmatimonadota bacterium]